MVIALGLVMLCNNAVSAKTKATYKKGVVTIKGKGKYTSKKYQKNKKVKKVIVGKNVTKIGNNVFSTLWIRWFLNQQLIIGLC